MHAELLDKGEWTRSTPKVRQIKPGRYVDPHGNEVQVYGTLVNDQVVYRMHGKNHQISRPLALLKFKPAVSHETDEQWISRQPTGAVAGICTLVGMMLALAVVLGIVALAVL